MENTNKIFKCSICEKEYSNVMDRAHCELACSKKQQEEVKKAAELQKQAEKAASEAKVTEAFDAAYKMRDEHVAKYGFYSYTRKEPTSNKSAHPDWPTLSDVFNFLI